MFTKDSTTNGRPAKPPPDFPLYAHRSRRWAKKICGKTRFFGPWRDPDGALRRYLAEKDALEAGQKPRREEPSATVALADDEPMTTSCPAKPYPEFPLYAHASGRWAKKIRGKTHFFGPWRDPHQALTRYLAEKDDLEPSTTLFSTLTRLTQRIVSSSRDSCANWTGSKRLRKYCEQTKEPTRRLERRLLLQRATFVSDTTIRTCILFWRKADILARLSNALTAACGSESLMPQE